MTSAERSLHFANQFVISCGTVSVDVTRAKILLIRSRTTGEYFLPKGRKDIGERLEDTATRETFEETGIPVELLPANFGTLATVPSSAKADDRPKAIIEPVAVTQRSSNGILKIIFWYVAAGDSTMTPQQGTQQEGEDYDAKWVVFDEVESTLSFDDDRRIALRVLDVVR